MPVYCAQYIIQFYILFDIASRQGMHFEDNINYSYAKLNLNLLFNNITITLLFYCFVGDKMLFLMCKNNIKKT